jgi:quaternary ammonium compound-resistance protein SugE
MAWLYLTLSGLLEIAWALGIKRTEGFTRLWPSIYTLATMGVGFYLLALAVRTLPIGTAYAVWVGIGAVGTAVVGLLFLGEPPSPLRLGSIALIVLGVVGLRLAEGR